MGNVSSCLFCCFLKIWIRPVRAARKKSLTALPVPRGGTGQHKVFFPIVLLYFAPGKSRVLWWWSWIFCCCSALGNLWPVSFRPRVSSVRPSLNLTPVRPFPSSSFRCRAPHARQCHTIWRRRGITACDTPRALASPSALLWPQLPAAVCALNPCLPFLPFPFQPNRTTSNRLSVRPSHLSRPSVRPSVCRVGSS